MAALFVLFETAAGFSLFNVHGLDELGASTAAVQQSVADLERFGKVARLEAWQPFTTAAQALEQVNAVSESELTQELQDFLKLNLPQVKKLKKAKYELGVADAKLGSLIQERCTIPCVCNDFVGEVLRGVRRHATRFLKGLEELELQRTQLGLAHSYSRAKVKFNVNRVDNMVIQAIALLDTLDKDVNTFVMRVREWYSWHFPELVKIVSDNYQYARLALAIEDKGSLTPERLPELVAITADEEKAQEILDAARTSMGQDISPIDLINIKTFAARVISLAEYRLRLQDYLLEKMHAIAPNLSSLIGETVGARLISHAGSLTNLAKYPASTVQILGAEKALFRALKTKGNTPKYGLIFHSSFIGRAKQRNKGRISRYLANKCSIASRIDCFSDTATMAFGEKMREQVEERLRFYDEGIAPTKNLAAMQAAMQAVAAEEGQAGATGAGAAAEPAAAAATLGEEPKKKKKRRKEGLEAAGVPLEGVPAAQVAAAAAEATVLAPEASAKKKGRAVAEAVAEAGGAEASAAKPKKKKRKGAPEAEQTVGTELVAAALEAAPAGEGDGKVKKKKKKQRVAE